MSSTPYILKAGQRISHKGVDKYEVVKGIGKGRFSEVYKVEKISNPIKSRPQSSSDFEKSSNGQRLYALKLETKEVAQDTNSTPLKSELRMMRKLGDLGEWVCELVDEGVFEDSLYGVFELCGQNLSDYLRQNDLNIDQVIDIAAKTLKDIQQLHKAGVVHRDIKPANFVLSKKQNEDLKEASWKIIDFGLARKCMNEKNMHLSERTEGLGFRGSVTYASIAAHKERDLSRRDDIWSWWYILVEMIQGDLPWRKNKPKEEAQASPYILQYKEKCLKTPELLFKNRKVPGGILQMMNHVSRLEFEDGPDFGLLLEWLELLRGIEVFRPISCSRKNSRQQLQQLMQNDQEDVVQEDKVSGNSYAQNRLNGSQQPGEQQQTHQQQLQGVQNLKQAIAEGSVKRNVQNFEGKIQEQSQQSSQMRPNSQQIQQQQQQFLQQQNNINGALPQDSSGLVYSNQQVQNMQEGSHQNIRQQQYYQQQQNQVPQQQNQLLNNKQQIVDQQLSSYMNVGNQSHAQSLDYNNKQNQQSLKRNRSLELDQHQQQQQQNKYQKMGFKPLNEDQQKGQQVNSHQHERILFNPHQKHSRWDVVGTQKQEQFQSNQEGTKCGRQGDHTASVFQTPNVDARMKRQRGEDAYHHRHQQPHQHQSSAINQQTHARLNPAVSPRSYSHHKLSSTAYPSFQIFVDAYKQNQLRVEVTRTVENLSKLRPIEAMAAIGTVIEGMTHLQPHKLHRVSKVLDSLSQYIKDAAEKSKQKFQKASSANHWG